MTVGVTVVVPSVFAVYVTVPPAPNAVEAIAEICGNPIVPPGPKNLSPVSVIKLIAPRISFGTFQT